MSVAEERYSMQAQDSLESPMERLSALQRREPLRCIGKGPLDYQWPPALAAEADDSLSSNSMALEESAVAKGCRGDAGTSI